MTRVRGLSWMRTSEAIRAFVSQFGHATPRRALLCTFNLDVSRFEESLLPELTRRGRQFHTLIMADAGALQSYLAQIGEWQFRRYQVAPINCRRGGVFHPKLVVLVAGLHCLVGVGSANLTAGGLGGNLELMLFCCSPGKSGEQLASGARSFLDSLLEVDAIDIPRTARSFVKLLCSSLPSRGSGALLHSLNRALLPQMVAAWRNAKAGSPRTVDVLSPWHSGAASPDQTDPEVIRHVRRAFNARVSLYTDGRNGRGPDLGTNTSVFVRSTRIDENNDDEEGGSTDRRPGRVHAKAYLIEGRSESLLVFGSANCTQPALLRSSTEGGNVELLASCRVDEASRKAVRADLEELFRPASDSFVPLPSRFSAGSRGVILCGHMKEDRSGPYLEIEAPGARSNGAKIASVRNGRTVSVAIHQGRGEVRTPVALDRLFRGEHPHRTGTFWGTVLWERVESLWVPFPVFVPVVGDAGGDAADRLEDLAMDEFGVWPADVNNQGPQSDAREDDKTLRILDEDDDAKALVNARHQGQLDRLAVATSRIRKRIARADKRYQRERLKVLRDQIAALDLSNHVRRTLLNYIGRRVGATRR